MSRLIDTAKAMIEWGTPRGLYPFLRECIDIGSTEALMAVKLLARDMYGGFTFNYEMKAPAAHALIAWGETGIKAITENVTEVDSSKNHSLAITILAPLAAGQFPAATGTWIHDSDLIRQIHQKAGDPKTLQPVAKKYLNEFIMGISDPDDVALFVGTSLHQIALSEADAVRPLFQASALRYTAVGLLELAEFEQLLATAATDEPAFHSFFERNPLFLDPLALRVWSKPDLHGKKEPDFLVQRTDNSYLIIEIETPAKTLVTSQNQLSADTTHAITQALEYRSFLAKQFPAASATFPNFSVPDCLVVTGRQATLDADQLNSLRLENEHRSHMTILGFDELAKRTRAITENVINASIPVETIRLA